MCRQQYGVRKRRHRNSGVQAMWLDALADQEGRNLRVAQLEQGTAEQSGSCSRRAPLTRWGTGYSSSRKVRRLPVSHAAVAHVPSAHHFQHQAWIPTTRMFCGKSLVAPCALQAPTSRRGTTSRCRARTAPTISCARSRRRRPPRWRSPRWAAFQI